MRQSFGASLALVLLVPGGVHAVVAQQKQSGACTPDRPQGSPAQGRRQGTQGQLRSRWLARLGAGDQRVEWRKPLCPLFSTDGIVNPVLELLRWQQILEVLGIPRDKNVVSGNHL